MAPSGVAQNLASVKWGTVLKFTATEAKKYAHGLTVNRENTIIKKVECLKKTSYDFYPYMTKAGSYIFKVRTVPGTETEKNMGRKVSGQNLLKHILRKKTCLMEVFRMVPGIQIWKLVGLGMGILVLYVP